MGSRAAVLDNQASEQSAEWFNTFEAAHDVVFYRGDAPDSAWTHQCLRQADRIFLLARADQPLPLRPLDLPAFKERASGLPELLLLHPPGARAGLPEHFSLRSGLFESHHHIRAGNNADVAAAGALHRRARRGPGAGGRRRARLCPYRHHQGADGSATCRSIIWAAPRWARSSPPASPMNGASRN